MSKGFYKDKIFQRVIRVFAQFEGLAAQIEGLLPFAVLAGQFGLREAGTPAALDFRGVEIG